MSSSEPPDLSGESFSKPLRSLSVDLAHHVLDDSIQKLSVEGFYNSLQSGRDIEETHLILDVRRESEWKSARILTSVQIWNEFPPEMEDLFSKAKLVNFKSTDRSKLERLKTLKELGTLSELSIVLYSDLSPLTDTGEEVATDTCVTTPEERISKSGEENLKQLLFFYDMCLAEGLSHVRVLDIPSFEIDFVRVFPFLCECRLDPISKSMPKPKPTAPHSSIVDSLTTESKTSSDTSAAKPTADGWSAESSVKSRMLSTLTASGKCATTAWCVAFRYPICIGFNCALFLGTAAHGDSRQVINDLRITHVINATLLSKCTFEGSREMHCTSVKYLRVAIGDMPHAQMSAHFDECNAFIDSALTVGSDGKRKGRVLVHCQRGVSRSAAIVAAYLIFKKGLTAYLALASVKAKKPDIEPNPGFVEQLLAFHSRLQE